MKAFDQLIPLSAQLRLQNCLKKNSGWLSFEQFMAAALYDSKDGYYTTNIREVGRTGDFSTSAQPDSLLGRAIAAWARNQRKKLGSGFRWHLIEVGGGNGDLAATILNQMGFWARLGLTYHMVEISRPLREIQIKKLRPYRVCWHESTLDALQTAEGEALIFSNELIDAYPCRRLHYDGANWYEIGLVLVDDHIQESTQKLSLKEVNNLHSSVSNLSEQTRPQTVEIHSAYRKDLLKIGEKLIRGCMLTIDYGDYFPALYHRQPAGTLRGYFHHLRVEGADLYTRMGHQDLTADVNFTDLENWGVEAGFATDRMEVQGDFISRWIGTTAPKTTDEARVLDPMGAGTAFKVLQQSRNMCNGC